MVKLDDIVEQRTEKVVGYKDPDLPYIGLEHIAQAVPTLLGMATSDSSVSVNSVFEPGDILFGKLRPNLRKSIQVDFRGYCSTDILVFRPRPSIDPKFAARVFQHESVFNEAVRTAEGTKMPRTAWNRLKEYSTFVPSLPAQQHIAAILDALDDTIRHTRALVDKLQAMRAGLLYDLLTRGLDERGQLRPVPEEAPELYRDDSTLGKVPRAWEIVRLEAKAQIASGVTLGRKVSGPEVVELPYLRVANVQDARLDLTEIKTVRVYQDEVSRYVLQNGDVLLTEGGDFDKLGRGAIWQDQISPCLHQNHIFRVRPHGKDLHSPYFAALIGSIYGKKYFLGIAKQTTNLASINSTQLKAFPLLRPEIEEQKRIARALEAHDERVQAEEAELAKLEALKPGLMDDLLTGRVCTLGSAQEG